MVRIAAAGDVHASAATRSRIAEAFAAVEREADLVLLAGDLTTHGEMEQAEVLAEATRGIGVPIVAVLGNHDLHSGHGEEIAQPHDGRLAELVRLGPQPLARLLGQRQRLGNLADVLDEQELA